MNRKAARALLINVGFEPAFDPQGGFHIIHPGAPPISITILADLVERIYELGFNEGSYGGTAFEDWENYDES